MGLYSVSVVDMPLTVRLGWHANILPEALVQITCILATFLDERVKPIQPDEQHRRPMDRYYGLRRGGY